MIKTTTLAAALLTATLMTGCASSMTIGSSKFSGNAPTGYACADGLQAIELTNDYQNGDYIDADFCKEDRKARKAAKAGKRLSNGQTVAPFPDAAIHTNRQAGVINEPKPVMMPAQVMSVWINAYQASDGSLVYPGRVFTEVTPRRWNVGYAAAQGIDSNRTISPLSVKVTAKSEPQPQEAAEDVNLNRVEQQQAQVQQPVAQQQAPATQTGSTANPLPPLR